MEGAEEVGLVLSRASELRSKIDRRILENVAERRLIEEDERLESKDDVGDAAELEEDSLIEVRDALESLEQELSSLQARFSSSLPLLNKIKTLGFSASSYFPSGLAHLGILVFDPPNR